MKADTDTTRILKRAARELWDGCYANFGIGLPVHVLKYIPEDMTVFSHSENGMLGSLPQYDRSQMDPMIIGAGGEYVRTIPGASFFDSSVSFAMVRTSKLDLSMLGAFEVDAEGNLANWIIPGKFAPGIGGAMELAAKSKRLVILMNTLDKYGNSKIKNRCTLPLTAGKCVSRIITEHVVIDVTSDGLLVKEIAKGLSLDELKSYIDAPFEIVSDPEIFE